MQFRVLGPLEVVDDDGAQLSVRGDQARRILALLVMAPNQVVSSDKLVDSLWDDDAPNDAVSALRVNMSRLRKTLGPVAGSIVTKAPGYALAVAPESVDAVKFEQLVAVGRRELRDGRAADAASTLATALALWRGPALADLADWPPVLATATRLEEARLGALEDRVDADIASGGHAALVGELESLTTEHPLRERLWAARMLALYRAGRQADALRAFQALRNVMVDELGIEPSPDLRRLEQRIVAQDPSLDRAAPTPASEGPAPEETTGRVRVMLVDDHPMWREVIASALERKGIGTVVGEAEDGESAVDLALETRPDVILMDLHLPKMHGTEATRRIVAEHPAARILMLSSSGEEADVLEAVKAGAQGYLLKTGTASEVVDAVARVANGESVFTPSLAGVVLAELRGERAGAGLSSEQREILRLLSGGATPAAISETMGINEERVRGELATTVTLLQGGNATSARRRALCSVLFVDVVGSTALAVEMGDARWHKLLERYHDLVRSRAAAHGGRAVKTAGDGVFAAFEDPGSAIAAAGEVSEAVVELGFAVRAGLHMGECEVSADDVNGLAVHIGARVSSAAAAGEVLVSHTVHDLLLGSGRTFEDRGTHTLRGVPGQWRLYAVGR